MLWLQRLGSRVPFGLYSVSSSLPESTSIPQEVCFTGNAQQFVLASKLLALGFELDTNFHIESTLRYLKGHHFVGCSNPFYEGGLPGSKPLYGSYQPMALPEWAVKFFIDALLIDSGYVNPLAIDS